MAKRRKRAKQRKAGVSQRVSQVTVVHVGDKKRKGRKKKRRKAASAAEAATAAISASMGRPVDLGLMNPQLQSVLAAHNTMQRQTLYSTPFELSGVASAPVSALTTAPSCNTVLSDDILPVTPS